MRLNIYILFFFLLNLFFINNAQAQIEAISSGNWGVPSTWKDGDIPLPGDDVVIDGHTVTINVSTNDVYVKSISVSNNTGNSKLIIDGNVTVNIEGDLKATSDPYSNNATVEIRAGGIVKILGNVNFSRSAFNTSNGILKLTISETSEMIVDGDFTYDYKNGNTTGLSSLGVELKNTAKLEVKKITNLYLRGGKEFKFEIRHAAKAIFRGDLNVEMSGGTKMKIHNHSILTVGGNLDLKSTSGGDSELYFELYEIESVTRVSGDISMSALSEDVVFIKLLKNGSNLYVAGNFLRPTNYGNLEMHPGATLTYNGTVPQEIAAESLDGAGSDEFKYTNVVLDNPAGFLLTDTMFVADNLELSSGNIKTTPENPIVIGDGATITGGSDTAYVDGPMIKRGSSNGENFVFPIGNENTYAPIEISATSGAASEYAAQYFGDPPPFGISIAPDVESISVNQYWTLNRTEDSEDVNVVLHWMDGAANNLNALATLFVVGLSDNDVWESYGNGGTTGGTGAGESGSVSSALGDPPPFGIVNFTIGSTEAFTTDVDELQFEKDQILSVYPNPVDDILNVKTDKTITDEGMLEVFDISGRRIYSKKCIIENGRLQLSSNTINARSAGLYLIRFTTAEESHICKFHKR